MNKQIEKAAIYLEEKDLMPKTKTSSYFEELYSHPAFCWRVPPFPLMGNDLETLLRLPIIRENNRSLKVLDDVSGSIVARLMRDFPTRTITGVVNDQQKCEESNQSLEMLNFPKTIRKENMFELAYEDHEILITATNITEQERLIKHLQESNFVGDLIAYRYNPPGPKPTSMYESATYPWYRYSFSDESPIVEIKKSRLNMVMGTKRYCQVNTVLHCNVSSDKLQVNVPDELAEFVEVKLGKEKIIAGEKVSMELSFKAYDAHSKNITSGVIEFSDGNDKHKCSIEIIVVSMPMVEPALARWSDIEELPTSTMINFFENESFHVIVNWAATAQVNGVYDYH